MAAVATNMIDLAGTHDATQRIVTELEQAPTVIALLSLLSGFSCSMHGAID